jgi:crossover junction endodeoxyribonuclease RusA
VIELPFPDKLLWPNGRTRSYLARWQQTKKHREWARLATLAAKIPAPNGRVDWSVTIHPKTGNVIDRDNAHASLKSYADGIAQALGVDDKLFNTPSLTFGEPIKGGLVRIEVLET